MSRFCFSSDSAVSPVIAAILIIALTVIIAASVGAVVLGLVNPASLTGNVVGVTAEPYAVDMDHGVRMTYWGGRDAGQLESIRAEIGGYTLMTPDGKMELTEFTVGGKYDFSLVAVRDTETVDETEIVYTRVINADALPGVPVNFVGKFKDGSEQIIYMWKLSVPGISGSNGIFYEGDGISVSGFYNNTTIPGRGISITRLNPDVKSVLITGLSLTDTQGNLYDRMFLSKDSQKKQSFSGEKLLFPFIAGPSATTSPYREGTFADALTGTVDVEVTYNDQSTKTIYAIPINIDPRVNILDNPAYHGGIVRYDESDGTGDDHLYVRFNPDDGLLNSNHQIFVGLESGNDKTELNSYSNVIDNSYYSPKEHDIHKVFDLTNKDKSAYVAVYVCVTLGDGKNGPPVWYLIDRKTVGELTQSH